MSQLQPEVERTPKKVHSKNDNCENCVREKKENEKFISIYERLQKMASKSSQVNQAVHAHRVSSDTNRSFYRTFEQRVVSLPKNKKEISSQLLENVGFQLAASLLEEKGKRKVVEENQRLKEMICQMRKDKWEQPEVEDSLDMMKTSCFLDKKKRFSQVGNTLDRTYNSYLPPSPVQPTQTHSHTFSEPITLENMLLSNASFQNSEQNTTQSSSFIPPRPSADLSRYSDMNLWLYQSQKNAKLQEQLYLPQKSRNKSFISKKTVSRLPSVLRPKK